MKRKIYVTVLVMALVLLLVGCGCKHEWLASTCSAPKTCQLCGETEGEALPHTWQDATCSAAKTCTVCKATEGEALPHTWQDATCTTPKTCTVCKATEGEALPHTWQDATCTTVKTCTVCQTTEGEALGHTWQDATCSAPKTCSVCNATEGEKADHKWKAATTEAPKTCSVCAKTSGSKLNTDSRFTTKATIELQGTWVCNTVMTEEMTGLDGFGNVECKLTLKFGNTGKMTLTTRPKDEKAFLKKMKTYNIEVLYAAFAEDGLSKAQADQAMQDAYGLNVEEYVEEALKDYKVADAFEVFDSNMVYYVKDGELYTAISWKAKFEQDKYTLKNGVLTIENVSLEEGGEPLQWKKA